jgi:alanyl-tRNA synthetase
MYCSIDGGDAAEKAPSSRPTGTERLYYVEAYRPAFTARVVTVGPAPDGRAREDPGDRPAGVVLDRTAFYPTSGGQPHDTGTLAGLPVVDVIEAGEEVIHVLGGPVSPGRLAVGAEVEGVVDWPRRFDHMQQHTAQHVLSAVFLQVLGVETVSVHLGESSTLDLEIPACDPGDIRRVEEGANQIVYENRPVTVRFVDAAASEALGLRRPPRRTGPLRIVEIADCDRSACGGTHVRSTGEIGPVLIRRWERTRGRVRVEFLAGWRAVRDYQRKHALVSEWSARLTVGERDLGEALDRLARDAQEGARALEASRRRLLGYEALERLAAVPPAPVKILRLQFPQREPEEVRALLREMTARDRCIVLAGITETGRLYFARSPGDGPQMADLLARTCRAVGGRGGGTAEFAQGAVAPGEPVARALALGEEEVRGA